jgi:UDP-glucose 4-epimerase
MSPAAPPGTVLVTGGFGFLGRACAQRFRRLGWRVVGIGHGDWPAGEALACGYDRWVDADVSTAGLSTLRERFDVVAHCASNGSVPYSLSHPLDAFSRTVGTTADLLEHLRTGSPGALVVYPSSAAVYGAADDRPLAETNTPNPVSPYGFHKRMTEDLLASYAQSFGLRVAVVRFFSIYGPGLAKQLLWDAAGRLLSGQPRALFWGTGEETRDWIHVDDAASLFAHLATAPDAAPFRLVNGARGDRVTVAEVLGRLRDALGVETEIDFNGAIKPGDPRFYLADVARLHALGWRPSVPLADGLAQHARWVRDRLAAPTGVPLPPSS